MDLLLCAGCRDYIHIMDLAVGHVAALKQILNPDFTGIKVSVHRLNMELDLQSLVGLLCTAVRIG
jgi:hypothetical protein